MINRNRSRTVLPAVLAMSSLAAVALWQFYTFVTFASADGAADIQGERRHFWWASAFAAGACVAGFFVFSLLMRYDRNAEMHITSPPPTRMVL